MEDIIIIVSGGFVQDIQNIPKDIVIRVRDYDSGEVCDNEEIIQVDEDGDRYEEGVWVGEIQQKRFKRPEKNKRKQYQREGKRKREG